MILFDMIGDADLHLEQDTNSDRDLLRLFLAAARSTNQQGLFSRWQREIEDDHVPFQEAGIPCLDLIDFSYGPRNEHWHAVSDRIENCSAESLGAVGRLTLATLPAVEAMVQGP